MEILQFIGPSTPSKFSRSGRLEFVTRKRWFIGELNGHFSIVVQGILNYFACVDNHGQQILLYSRSFETVVSVGLALYLPGIPVNHILINLRSVLDFYS